MNNKLSVVSALIKDIINKYYIHCDGNINTIINEFIENSKNLETIDSEGLECYKLLQFVPNCNINLYIRLRRF